LDSPNDLLDLHTIIGASIAKSDWKRASMHIAALRQARPNDPRLKEFADRVEPEFEKLQAAKAEDARRKAVEDGLAEAWAVAADSRKCETPRAIADAWAKLRQVQKSDPEWENARSAAGALEACRQKAERTLSRGLRQLMVSQRESWASQAEVKMLDQGMDVRITLSGVAKDSVTLKWVLMSRPVVHKITKGGSMREGAFLENLKKIGFRHVTFNDATTTARITTWTRRRRPRAGPRISAAWDWHSLSCFTRLHASSAPCRPLARKSPRCLRSGV
jgi:hypothetical protein